MKLPVGCDNLLNGIILYILITVIPGASGRCEYTHRQCSDGSCIPANSVTKCPDTSCVPIHHVCPNNCGSGYKQCRGGKCIPSYKKCPGECERYERECPDGSCTASHRGLCPGECKSDEKKCLGGTCINGRRECPEECKHDEKWCPDGTCVSSSRGKCRGERCPHGFPISCTFGENCYRDSEICDGTRHCLYGSDEKNCISSFWWVWYVLIPCVVVIIPFIVYFMCCKSKKKREICLDEVATEPALQNENVAGRANGTHFGHEEPQGTYSHPDPQVPSAPPEADPEVDPQSEPEAPPSYASIMASDKNWETPTSPTLPPSYANATVKTEFKHTGTADENGMDRYGPQFWGTGPDH